MPPQLVLQTLRTIWIGLQERNLPVALAGGLVLPVWNYPRSTQDIDMLLWLDDESGLIDACRQLACHPRRTPNITRLGTIHVLQTFYRPKDEYVDIAIDFLIGKSPFHQQVLERAVSVTFESIELRLKVVTCEDLILLKLDAGRMIDLADCQRLIELNGDELDRAYLNHWVEKLGVTDAFRQVSEK